MVQNNVIGWFEISVTDMERAMKFYTDVFGVTLSRHQVGEYDMAWFPMEEGYGSAGALVKHDLCVPSKEGTMVYFTSKGGDLNVELEKVEAAGGKVVREKYSIGEHGHVGVIEDTEGNYIAVHSME